MPSSDRLTTDLRWAGRTAARRPLFSLLAAGTLAVAIGAATTALGLATAVLWRPLPFNDAERVVFVWENNPTDAQALRPQRVTGSRYAAWRDHHRSLESLALFGAAGFSIEGPDGRADVRGVRVSASYFDTLGATPLLGRTFTPADEIPGQHFVVLLAHDFWQQQLGGRPDVVGTQIRLSGQPYTIVGVMPPQVYPAWPLNPATVTLTASSRQLWVPIARSAEIDGNARSHVYGVIGRLRPDVTLEQATADLAGLAGASPDPHGVHLTPLRTQLTGDARQPLLIVLASAAAVLLVACANLAALYLASFERRRGELATRASLGAGSRELVRLLALEALLVAGAGGAAGIAVARGALTWLPAALPPTVPFVTAPTLDLRLALTSAATALLAGLLLAAWPIARLLRHGPAPRGLPERARSRAYGVLVAAQLAVTVALVSAAAWLGQSLWSVQSRDAGFRIDDVVVADISVPAGPDVTAADLVAAEDRLRAAVGTQADVRGVALAYDHPLEANWTDGYLLAGHDTRPEETATAQLRIVSPSYFDALDVAIVDGRLFTDHDGLRAGGVALVNESFAREHGDAVVGRTLRSLAARRTWGDGVPDIFTILGVVEDERFRGLEEPTEPGLYLSTRQFPQSGFSLVVRADQPRALAATLRAIVRRAEPRASVETPALLSRILSNQLAPRRLTTDVLGGLAGATLLLAGLGLYGLLAMMVAGQTREVGVRLALGATPSAVARSVIGAGGRYVLLGLAAGLLLALVAARLVRGLLVGVSASDPLTIAAVLMVMALTALTASLVPALRAARVDPVAALRAE
jgi:predicted permease